MFIWPDPLVLTDFIQLLLIDSLVLFSYLKISCFTKMFQGLSSQRLDKDKDKDNI